MFRHYNFNQRNRRLLALSLALSISLALISGFSGPSKSSARNLKQSFAANERESHSSTHVPKETAAAENYGHVGLSFEANQGQTDSRVNFITRSSASTVFLTPTEAVMVLNGSRETAVGANSDSALGNLWSLRMQIDGANPQTQVRGVDELPGKVNYFKGNDSSQWH